MKTLIYWNCNYTIITETDPTQMAYTFMSLRDKMTKPDFFFFTFRESIQVYHRRYTHPSNTASIYLKTSILHSLSQRNLYIQVSLRQIQIFFPAILPSLQFWGIDQLLSCRGFLYITIVIFMNR